MKRAVLFMVFVTASCGRPHPGRVAQDRMAATIVHADGRPAAGAFFLATFEGTDDERLVRADQTGTVVLDIARPVAIAIASEEGVLFLPHWEPRHGERFVLDDDCVAVSGDVIDPAGQPVDAEVVLRLRRYSEHIGDSFFVVARGGEVSACVPAARYSLTAEGGAFVTSSMSVVIAPDRTEIPTQRVWERAQVTTPAPEDATVALRAHATPATEVGGLATTLASARVIGCGEANHGAAELYRMRRDLLEALVDRVGTRLVLLEAGVGEGIALDHYLQSGEGDLASLIAGLEYWLWDTEEFTDVLRWIRDHNAAVSEDQRIHVAGIDVQTYAGAWTVIGGKVDDDLRARLALFEGGGANGRYRALEPAARSDVRAALDEVEARFATRGDDVWWAVRAVRQLLQLLEPADRDDAIGLRDRLMADNVLEAIAQRGGGPAMFWAHNAHVARQPLEGIPSAGMHLAAALGAGYVTIGYLTGEGALRAWDRWGKVGVIAQPFASPPPHAVEAFLARLDWPTYYLDLRGDGADRGWLDGPRFVREVGAAWPGEDAAFVLRDMVKSFDLIGFAARSDATHATPTGERRPEP